MKIENLKALEYGSPIEGVYALVNPGLKTTRTGTNFLNATLQDNSGQLPAVQWEVDDTALYEYYLQNFQVFTVRGRVDNYRDAPQVVIQKLTPVEKVSSQVLQEILPSLAEEKISYYVEEIKKLGKKLKDPGCITLFRKIIQDPLFMELFRQAPAAVMVHHAYCGGLAQHTACVMKQAWSLYQAYKEDSPSMNPDVILLGSFFHVLGKIEEIKRGPRFENTPEGNLLGHTMISLEMFMRLSDSVEGFSQAMSTAVKHCIISHHGNVEWGAAVVPKTLEAEIVFLADYTDSTLRQFVETIDANSSEWSDYNRFLERSVFSSEYDSLPSRSGLWESEIFEARNSGKTPVKKDNEKNPPDFKKHSLF